MIISTAQDFKFPAIQYSGTDGKREYRLLDDYCFEWNEKGFWYRRTVFKLDPGTQKEDGTDLASVPDEASALGFEQAGCSDAAAVLHDNGYFRLGKFLPGEFQILKNGKWIDCTEPFLRLRCDLLFRQMCILGGMPVWRANVEFAALRVGAISRRNGVKWYFS